MPALYDQGWLDVPTMAALFAGMLATAYVTAYVGVVRARRGDDLELAWLRRVNAWWGYLRATRRRPFASAAQAQRWLLWHSNGWNLSLFVFMTFVPALLCFPWIAHFEKLGVAAGAIPPIPGISVEASSVLKLAGALLLYLPGVATACGAALSGYVSKHAQLSPFDATRPWRTAALAAAAMRGTGRSAVAACGVGLALLALWLLATGHAAALEEFRATWLSEYSAVQVIALALLTVALPMMLTWCEILKGQFLVFTGRRRLIEWSILVGVFGFFALLVVLANARSRELLWALLPALATVAILLKLLAAGVAALEVRRQGLLETHELAKLLGLWLLTTLGLIALLLWLIPGGLVPAWLLICGVVLEIPLARLIAAPLALAWNRHR
jgi:hypothetical protein